MEAEATHLAIAAKIQGTEILLILVRMLRTVIATDRNYHRWW